jgi:quercetin 2,3-dioxygenase
MHNTQEKLPETYIYLAEKRQNLTHVFLTKGMHQDVLDVNLKPFENYAFQKNTSDSVLILPFIGDLTLKAANYDLVIDENKGLFLRNLRETNFEIQNIYENDIVNFLYIPFSENQTSAPFDSVLLNIEANKNMWHIIGSDIYIGQWEGRKKGNFTINTKNIESALIYCLSGVFEVNDRLLEQKDSLEIIHGDNIEFEALADNSILLIIQKQT